MLWCNPGHTRSFHRGFSACRGSSSKHIWFKSLVMEELSKPVSRAPSHADQHGRSATLPPLLFFPELPTGFVPGWSNVKLQRNSMECLSLLQSSCSTGSSKSWHLSDPQFSGFFLFNSRVVGNLGKLIFCMNFTLQKLDLPDAIHIGNTSEWHALWWWKTKSVASTLQCSYAVASFCIPVGTRKFLCIIMILTVASLNFETQVWNSTFHNASITNLTPQLLWVQGLSEAIWTECYVGVFSCFLP